MKSNIKKSSQPKNKPALQTILLLLFLVCYSVAGKAQVKPTSVLNIRNEINLPGTYKYIEVRGDVMVMLTNELAGNIWLEGDSTDFNNVKTTIKKGKLLINAERKRSFKKMIIYVPVTAVTALLITGDAEIFSSGTITTNGLEITLNGNSLVAVNYKGKLKISPADGYDLGDDIFSINKSR